MRLLTMLMLVLGTVAVEARDSGPLVRVIADESVLPGKLERLRAIAVSSGVQLEWAYSGAIPGPASPQAWIDSADLIIIEAPLPSGKARIQEQLGEVLKHSRVPRVEANTRRETQTQALTAYYQNGGETNLRHLFLYLKTWVAKGDLTRVPPPIVMTDAGFYHPDAPRLFASFTEYEKWGRTRWKAGAPRVGIAIHAFAIAGMQTQVIDGAIRQSEALGQMPLAFWFDSDDADALKKVIRPANPDVLINMHHMGNAPARTAEFLQLDIPVLQTLNHRDSSIAEWQQATTGTAPRMTAPFIAVYENWGMSDPMVISALEKGELVPMPRQLDAVLGKAAALTALRRTPNAGKKLALLFWNYPPGEKNLSASNLNVPRSLEALTKSLHAAGYDIPPTSEQNVIDAGQAMLGVLYKHEQLDDLLKKGLADTFPVRRYRQWVATLPAVRRDEINTRWGDPDKHWAVRTVRGERQFVIPRWQLGKLVVMPQLPRGGEPGAAYHDAAVPPNHHYLAAYLYLREALTPHALIHFGTHGTQEWLPGKDRGLSVDDYPLLAVGDLPVFYPYIQDNIGEALQAKRRGRAVIISHQTPPFAPSGLYKELADIHAVLHEYIQLDEGAVRDRTAERLRRMVIANNMNKDVGWTEDAMRKDFERFLKVLHDHLHELAKRSVPLGLHTLGHSASADQRLSTVVQQLGDDFSAAALSAAPVTHSGSGNAHAGHGSAAASPPPDAVNEVASRDFAELGATPPYKLLKRYVQDRAPLAEISDAGLRALIQRGIELDRHLADNQELPALLAGLSGHFIAPGSGGDPVRNPDVPNGRNLYGFEPDKLPTRSAYDAADDALQDLINDYRSKHAGKAPQKLAFSLWSVEAMRHMGITESQILHAMGLRPLWDKGGRVVALEIIPAAELGRPRIDAVVQVTGAYRDQFETFMRLLADATERLSQLDEPGNIIATNTRSATKNLQAKGLDATQARQLAATRLFGNQPGDYGVGLSDAALDSTSWENDAPLAEQYLSRLQYAYGAGKNSWGVKTAGVNAYAEQLKGVQAAVLSRSSNLYGVLTGDDPYQFLGGLSLAVRHLNGASPDLYIADLRQPKARMTTAARFLSDEMRTRYLNPQWIKAMQQEGYAGTLEVVDTTNNLWGWQAMDRSTVRADQWQAMHDVYVMDKYQLDMQQWFEKHNPMAQAQVLERMLEAIRKGYWDASEQTRREITQRWQQLAAGGTTTGAEITRAHAEQMAVGFGLSPGTAPPASGAAPSVQGTQAGQTTTNTPEAAAEQIRGQVMQESSDEAPPKEQPWRIWVALSALLASLLAGGLLQIRNSSDVHLKTPAPGTT